MKQLRSKGENTHDYVNYFIQKGNPIYFVKGRDSMYELDEVELPNFVTVPECTSSVDISHFICISDYNFVNVVDDDNRKG